MYKYTCACNVEPIEEHSCPFQEEIHGNTDENYCVCCDTCIQVCMMRI